MYQLRSHLVRTLQYTSLLLLICLSQINTAAAAKTGKPHRVLMLKSCHIGFLWEDRITHGVVSELDKSGLNIDLFIEHMDTKRYPRELVFNDLASLYKKKYETPPDLILVQDDNALDFVVEHQQTMFPGIPVVFTGINNYPNAHRLHPMGFTGITERVDIKSTIELALTLHPDTKRIVAIADTAPTALLHLKNYYTAAAEITAPIEFLDMHDWTFDELKEKLAQLPPHSLLLYLSVSRDREGARPPFAQEGQIFVLEHAKHPVYTPWESHGIGDGAVGGVVPDGTLHGRLAAQMAVRILQGEKVEQIPVLDNVGNRPMFEYGALHSNHIPLSHLPKNSIIINEPESFYYRYYKYIWATFSFITLQTIIIGILLFRINKSRRREREIMQLANVKLENRVEERTHELKLRTQELERYNEELNQYTYVASHDLQEPVRNLISYSTLLKEDLGDNLPDDVCEDLHYITSAASRMKQLVQDLLVLSRAGRSDLRTEPVALDDCVDHALDALRVRIDETQATVSRVPLPRVMGDATLLTQTYQNLIGNALKFVGDDPPVIQLTLDQDNEMWTLGVRDNGIGLAPEYATQIFKPFKRLHSVTEYEGTGIGLSICQKAIERHHGSIWVDSEPGKGSSFQFTLPVTNGGSSQVGVPGHKM